MGGQAGFKADPELVGEAKELYIPDTVYMVSDNSNYEEDSCEFSFSLMKEIPNFALFWAKKYGANPMNNPDTLIRFNVDEKRERANLQLLCE